MAMGKSDEAAKLAGADFKLVGFKNFVRNNPRSDRFRVKRFHHVEFWCGDATNTAPRFSWGLGMRIVAKSDLSTGNLVHASFLCRSGDVRFLFTPHPPYSPSIAAAEGPEPAAVSVTAPTPTFSSSACLDFSSKHGLGVRAIAVEVDDADAAFTTSVAHGAKPVSPLVVLDAAEPFLLRSICMETLSSDT